MQTNEQRLKQIFCEHLGVDESALTDTANLIDDLGTDSWDQVEIVMAVEEEFGIEITDDDAEKITTFGDALKYLNDHVRT